MAFSMPGGPEILNIELSSSSVLKYLTSIALFMKPISPLQLSFGIEEDVVRNTVDGVKYISIMTASFVHAVECTETFTY